MKGLLKLSTIFSKVIVLLSVTSILTVGCKQTPVSRPLGDGGVVTEFSDTRVAGQPLDNTEQTKVSKFSPIPMLYDVYCFGVNTDFQDTCSTEEIWRFKRDILGTAYFKMKASVQSRVQTSLSVKLKSNYMEKISVQEMEDLSTSGASIFMIKKSSQWLVKGVCSSVEVKRFDRKIHKFVLYKTGKCFTDKEIQDSNEGEMHESSVNFIS